MNIAYSQTEAFRDSADRTRQNFALSQMETAVSIAEKIKLACQSGVHDPAELASLLGKPLDQSEKEAMFQALLWSPNSADHPAFKREFEEWEKTQNWE